MLLGYNLCSNLGPKGSQDYMRSAIASLIEGYLHIIYLFLFMAVKIGLCQVKQSIQVVQAVDTN